MASTAVNGSAHVKGENGFCSESNGSNGHSSTDRSTNGATNGVHKAGARPADARSFLTGVFEAIMKKVVEEGCDRDGKLVEFMHPKELQSTIDLALMSKKCDDQKLLHLVEDVIRYSVKTGHPRFFNQLYSGLNEYGLAGAWITEALNTSQYTYEVAPVFTLMELEVIDKMCRIIGYDNGDGTFCPGGSISNIYGLNLARYHKFPEVKTEGMQALPKICVFTSEQSHYSVKKGAAFLGMGVNNVRSVPCDAEGRMDVSALEEMIAAAEQEDVVPLMVSATSGTTVLGAYDGLDEIADVCEKHGVWLHTDACWGGGALLSNKHKHLLKGLHRSDSVAWNAHKMMSAQLQCCAFLTKSKGLLQQCHSANATYLFQQDKFYDVSYDTGDKSLQCGRKVDTMKLWLMWKAMGDQGLEAHIDNLFECASYLVSKIKDREGFRLVTEKPMCTNVCFWYIPPSMRNQEETDGWRAKLATIAPALKERMVMDGSMLIGYTPLGNQPNFLRVVLANQKVRKEDMDFVVAELERLGSDL